METVYLCIVLWYFMTTYVDVRNTLEYELQCSLHWRQNDHGGISNHQPHDCLLNRLFRLRSKKTSKLSVTGLCPGPGEFPAQRASYAENVFIWWRHHMIHLHWERSKIVLQVLCSLSGRTSYSQISSSLEAPKLDAIIIISLWHLTGSSAVLLPQCLSYFAAIGK